MSTEQAEYRHCPDLGGLELLHARYHKQNFSRHTHEGYTVGLIETGAQRFFRSGGNHVAPTHTIILVNADEVHNGCAATEGGWSYQAMYPTPEQFDLLSKELGYPGAPYFSEPVVRDPTLAGQLKLTFDAFKTENNALFRQSLLYSVMVQLMSRHGRQRVNEPRTPRPQLQMAKEYLDAHCADDVDLESLAAVVGLSPFHLLRQFRKEFGLPPHAYQLQARIRLATRLIRMGLPPLKVGLDCGFYDQSHFSRHFKRVVGVPPGVYARSWSGNNQARTATN
ncbi:AraC family transcriptional regulator [Ferrimonas sp. YFM]|uniref:AraC family transcriptional regulator n=1 Tax=Ferrimonas sp. YFM TaxID=3028878 RepID=UPI002573DA92|nr:AraC family transcriptional regulator [Ferrimonas sp. YFM]BDY05206.1 AraC family transcriptional regulator [Ferrimonas sp. YFM]